jgi:hypothetical protein
LVCVLAALGGCAAAPASVAGPARDYYFSPRGDDSGGDGSTARPFASVTKAGSIRLNPGDRLLFEGGQLFRGNLVLGEGRGGTPDQPIVVGSFGNGRARIDAGEGYAVRVRNAGGVVVENLVLSGSGADRNFGSGVTLTNDLHGWAAKRLVYGRARIDAGEGYAVRVRNAGGVVVENLVLEGSGPSRNFGTGLRLTNDRHGWGARRQNFVRVRNVPA